MNWLISANPNIYNHASSFEHYGFLDWRQGKIKYATGDTVYIYCTNPIKMIQYKCKIENIDLYSSQIRDDKDYWIDSEEYFKSINGKFMRLRLLEQVSNPKMSLEKLIENGLKAAPQGAMKIQNQSLLIYIEKHFTDNYQIDFFPDILKEDESHYEGAKKSIMVNRYERSSMAREKAVKHHGFNCKVCNINFENVYGEIGKEFIHIHHLKPINEIGKSYKINYETDLAPVCPNCHSMLHRKINGKEPSIEELKRMLK